MKRLKGECQHELVEIVDKLARERGAVAEIGRARALQYLLLSSDVDDFDSQTLSQKLNTGCLRALHQVSVEGIPPLPPNVCIAPKKAKKAPGPNVTEKVNLDGRRQWMTKFMWSDLKVESAWCGNLSLVEEWRNTISDLRRKAQLRQNGDEDACPLTLEELAEALAKSPTLDLNFCSLQSFRSKRVSTPYTNNLSLALLLREELRTVITAQDKAKEPKHGFNRFKSWAASMVLREKGRISFKQRRLISAVSRALQTAQWRDEFCDCPTVRDQMVCVAEFFGHQGKAPQGTALRLDREAPRAQKKTALAPLAGPTIEGQVPSAICAPLHLIPKILQFVSLRQVLFCAQASEGLRQASHHSIQLRLKNFVYEPDFLHGKISSKRGRAVIRPYQAGLLTGLLESYAPVFAELDLRQAPKQALAPAILAPVLASMTSLQLLKLRDWGKEWRELSLNKLYHALPAGAALACFDDEGKSIVEVVKSASKAVAR